MCGITGLFVRDGQVDIKVLNRMRDSLSHRGPDDKGSWLSDDGRLGLAHRRLSIIDLSNAGHQPMVSGQSGRERVLVYNGEIYNFIQLREELIVKGCVFRSNSDTEVILHAYEVWGIDAINKLNGMFAFALYDVEKNKLILARDRFGEKPLFYSDDGKRITFASELKALNACPDLSMELDHRQALPYVIWGNFPYADTAIKGIKKLPPAHFMVFDLKKCQGESHCYWNPIDYIGKMPSLGANDLTRELDEILTDSVEKRLVADVPVGAFLSGGIDSSLVVAIMARKVRDLKTFTIGFDETAFNEAPYAKQIASHLGTDHHEYYISAKEAQELLLQLPAIYDEPFADSSAIPTYIVSKLAREHVKVALTGDGGDELFGGYMSYSRLRLFLWILKLPRPARMALASAASRWGSEKMRRHAAVFHQDHAWQMFLYINERAITKINDAEDIVIDRNIDPIEDSHFAGVFNSVLDHGPIQSAAFTDLSTYLTDDILTKVDRASMAVSLETRIPLLDFRVAEFALGLSEKEKMGRGFAQGKKALRSLLADYMPSELFERPKSGFSIPLAAWFRTDMRWLLDEYLDEGRIKKEGIFDARVIARLVKEHVEGKRDREAVLWSLVCWQMWRENWKI